ncbi:Fe-S cluster assembly sulfur transfer protein SufU [Paraburkholderia lacunae]|uniref:SUF system NifU family Fe-S cluster assembly protein n=1 Tax=Paraburkholderia lacunae TaxID=2211104 RepID=A0A370NDE0_9BURK|nr:SUF system NifU family Fe-S cluster assembly protein [Paraburkholderia lacunae]RDK03603.1 SUF system NifU family Fe-S cluster assembly protein [Paraburkholderia lacunae]
MNDLSELYQEVIFDHYRQPRNRGVLAGANRTAEGYNPLCGDKVTLYLRIEDGIVKEASFEGSGCAIATASASLMTEALKGKTEAEAQALFGRFREMVTASAPVSAPAPDLGKLAALSGVREFPARVKCATLAWHTLRAALQGENSTVSTE